MFLNLMDKKLFKVDILISRFWLLCKFSILLYYGEIPHFRKWILRKQDTEHFCKNVSFYKKPLKLHFAIDSFILTQIIKSNTTRTE